VGIILTFLVNSSAQEHNQAKYQIRYRDPVLQELDAQREKALARQDSLYKVIDDQNKAHAKQNQQTEIILHSDLAGVQKPASLEVFKTVQYFPPVAQYQSGMCWCFCATSFLESEVVRQTGKMIKLSELYTVYFEYLEKAAGFLRKKGDSFFGQGGEVNGVFRVMKKYGAVPAEAYSGLKQSDKHDHTILFEELKNYLEYCRNNNYWDEAVALTSIRAILNKYLGEPPQNFTYEGKQYTPRDFLQKVLKLKLDDYYDLISTTSRPFYSQAEFKVEDNWWHDSSYINLPLDVWYNIIKKSINNGYSLAIGGDVSEPGYLGFEDVAFIPDFDIPSQYITQDARELRIYNNTTADDHGLHVVGYANVNDRDWFLIKDSGRSSRWGKYSGYYLYREDFIKLKMLSFTVHKDLIQDILGRLK